MVAPRLGVIKKGMNQKIRLERHHPKRPNIHSLSKLRILIKQNLGCPVDQRACNILRGFCQRRGSEVCDLIKAFGVDDVFGFDVPVDDFLLMNEHERPGNVDEHLNVLILHKIFHFDSVPQRKLPQFNQDINVIADDPT